MNKCVSLRSNLCILYGDEGRGLKILLSAKCLRHLRDVSYIFNSVPTDTTDSLDREVLIGHCIFHKSPGPLDTITAMLVW